MNYHLKAAKRPTESSLKEVTAYLRVSPTPEASRLLVRHATGICSHKATLRLSADRLLGDVGSVSGANP